MPLAQVLSLCVLCAFATWTDVRSRAIPNRLTLTFSVFGIVLAAIVGGWRDSGVHLLAAAVTMAVVLILFVARVIGGGDGKLLIAIAAIGGASFAAEVALWTVLAGGCVAAAVMIGKGTFVPLLGRLMRKIVFAAADPLVDDAPSRIPFAPIIAAGTVAAIAATLTGNTATAFLFSFR